MGLSKPTSKLGTRCPCPKAWLTWRSWSYPGTAGWWRFLNATGWWLGHPSEKYEFVNWDDDIPNIWENKKWQPNHQLGYDWLFQWDELRAMTVKSSESSQRVLRTKDQTPHPSATPFFRNRPADLCSTSWWYSPAWIWSKKNRHVTVGEKKHQPEKSISDIRVPMIFPKGNTLKSLNICYFKPEIICCSFLERICSLLRDPDPPFCWLKHVNRKQSSPSIPAYKPAMGPTKVALVPRAAECGRAMPNSCREGRRLRPHQVVTSNTAMTLYHSLPIISES